MRCRACQRPTGSKGLNHTRPGFLEQTQLQSVTLHFLHVLRGWTGRREEARKARESKRERIFLQERGHPELFLAR